MNSSKTAIKKLVKAVDMTLAFSEYLKMPPISLAHFNPDPTLLELIPRDTMAKRLAIPIARAGRALTVALGDPFDLIAIDELMDDGDIDTGTVRRLADNRYYYVLAE